MVTYQALADLLDETLHALGHFDVDGLGELEDRAKRVSGHGLARGEIGIDALRAKKRLLEIVLKNGQENLMTLSRLHERNRVSEWVR